MKKVLFICFLVLTIAFPVLAAKQYYGAKVSLSNFLELSEIMEDPDKHVGKRVLVEGKVVMICARKGCWMDIESNKTNEIVHIKIPPGMFTFTMSAHGREVHIEGKMERVDLTKEEAIVWHANKSEDAGVDFDPKSVVGAESIYFINALGAELFD